MRINNPDKKYISNILVPEETYVRLKISAIEKRITLTEMVGTILEKAMSKKTDKLSTELQLDTL